MTREELEELLGYKNRDYIRQNIDDFVKTYKHIRYCEIIIDELGRVVEVNPSHTQTLINLSGMTETEVWKRCPIEANPIQWLTNTTGYIAVWYDFFIGPQKGLNRLQKRSLEKLFQKGLVAFSIN